MALIIQKPSGKKKKSATLTSPAKIGPFIKGIMAGSVSTYTGLHSHEVTGSVVQPLVVEVLPVAFQKVLVDTPASTDVGTMTQEFITLYKTFTSIDGKNVVKRMEEIKKSLQTIANDTMDKDKPAVFSCPNGELIFSERGKVTEIPDPIVLVADLVEKFGTEVAFSAVNIALGPLRKILSEMELQKYVTEVPGSRTLKVVKVT